MMASRFPRRRARIAAIAVLGALAAGCAPGSDGMMAGLGSMFGPSASADPAALIGLAPEQIGETLGRPELQRLEPPAEVWQYRSGLCVFDLYLYDQEEGRRAVHYEARSRSNGAVDPAECLGSVVARERLAAAEDAAPADPAQL